MYQGSKQNVMKNVLFCNYSEKKNGSVPSYLKSCRFTFGGALGGGWEFIFGHCLCFVGVTVCMHDVLAQSADFFQNLHG